MRLTALVFVMIAVPLMGLLAACGGGGGGTNLTGWWVITATGTGPSGSVSDEALVQASQTGTSVWISGNEFTLSGSTLTNVDTSEGALNLQVVSNDRLQGTFSVTSGGSTLSADVVGVRTSAPTGTLQLDGTSGASVVAIDSTTAYARVELQMVGPSQIYELDLVNSEPLTETEVSMTHFSNPATDLMPSVPYSLGGGGDLQLNLGEWSSGVTIDSNATAGTLTFTVINASRAAGTFTADLDSGGTLTGSFDTPILYTDTDP